MRLSPRHVLVAAVVPLVVLAAAGCAPKEGSTASGDSSTSASAGASDSASASASANACSADSLPLKNAGKLTVATDSPAYPPWFVDDKPTNGQGYESAVTYAVAKQLGFTQDQVSWITVPFNNSYAPGAKNFDFDVNQISITPARQKVVDFSRGYYTVTQAVVALKDSEVTKSTSIGDLAYFKLGAQTGTTSLSEIRDTIKPHSDPLVFDDTNAATQALKNGQVDAIVADLPTAFYITSAELDNGTIVGQFKGFGDEEQFGFLAEKGSGLVSCLNTALDALDQDGTLASLEKQWLSDSVDVPVLQ